MQHLSLSNSSNMTAPWDQNQDVNETSGCLSLDLHFSDKTFLAFLLLFFACVLFSFTANGFLFFLTVRFKKSLWQSQYILIKHLSACGVGMSFVTGFVVASSVARRQTQIYWIWCIAHFCTLRVFVLTVQMTLALMAVERYIFICYGIHYLRVINDCNVHISMGLIWLVSGALSLHGGSVLSRVQCGFQQQLSGLLCNAFTIKKHITFSQEESMLLFGPPSVITTFCILAICYCYGCTHRGVVLLMFLLQLVPNVSVVIAAVMGKKRASTCQTISSIVMPLLIIIPPCINAAFLLIRNPEIRRLFFSSCCHTSRAPVTAELEVFVQKKEADELEEDAREVGSAKRVEGESKATTPPLSGCVFPSISED